MKLSYISKRLIIGAGSVLSVASLIALSGCGDEEFRPIYRLESTRVVSARFFQTDESITAAAGCAALTDANCKQQTPARPGKITHLEFLVAFPATTKPVSMQIKSVESFSGFGRGNSTNRALSSAGGAVKKPSNIAVTLNSSLTDAANAANLLPADSPVQVKKFVFDFTTPTQTEVFEALQKQGSDFPIYNINYSATQVSNDDRIDEQGFATIVVLPAPDVLRPILNTIGVPDGVSETDFRAGFAALLKVAQRNNPPVISKSATALNAGTGISIDGEPKSKDKVEVEARIDTAADADEGRSSRVLWFVSQGDMANERARKTKWTPKNSGKATAIVVVRDGQGGMDYDYKSTEVK